jgi:hypothetical protein
MKILFANKFFFRKGGAETVMFNEIEILRPCEVDVVEFRVARERADLCSRGDGLCKTGGCFAHRPDSRVRPPRTHRAVVRAQRRNRTVQARQNAAGRSRLARSVRHASATGRRRRIFARATRGNASRSPRASCPRPKPGSTRSRRSMERKTPDACGPPAAFATFRISGGVDA